MWAETMQSRVRMATSSSFLKRRFSEQYLFRENNDEFGTNLEKWGLFLQLK